jgi:polyisoprenoid-binding protein YceI
MARILIGALVFLLCALGANGNVRSAEGAFRVDSDLTSARFAVVQLGISKEQGRLGRTSGTIVMDAQHKVESIDFEIDTRAVDTGWNLRDAFLRSEVMFDTAHFPRMRFHSTRFAYDGPRLTAVEGEVTLRGVTRAVRLEVTRLECGTRPDDGRESCSAEVVGRISRAAFGMDFGYPLIGDEVELEFAVTAFRAGPAEQARKP